MVKTRESNKLAHPGQHVAPKLRRTKDEVQAERAAKAQAKADSEEAKKQSILRAAEFEHAERANEDLADATPCPPFKSQPPHSRKKTSLIPVAETSDVEMFDDVDNPAYVPPPLYKVFQ
jgi:sRNA-binding protein